MALVSSILHLHEHQVDIDLGEMQAVIALYVITVGDATCSTAVHIASLTCKLSPEAKPGKHCPCNVGECSPPVSATAGTPEASGRGSSTVFHRVSAV